MSKAAETSFSKAAKSRVTDLPEPFGVASILSGASVVVGEVFKINADDTLLVDYPQNTLGPIEARTITEDLYLGAKVLLTFERGDPTLPIVLGRVHDRVRAKGRVLHLKASSVMLEAEERLSLQCGEGRVEIQRDGKVLLRGKDIVSRAARTNKVQGATVRMN